MSAVGVFVVYYFDNSLVVNNNRLILTPGARDIYFSLRNKEADKDVLSRHNDSLKFNAMKMAFRNVSVISGIFIFGMGGEAARKCSAPCRRMVVLILMYLKGKDVVKMVLYVFPTTPYTCRRGILRRFRE